MKKILLDLSKCYGLGDTLAVTPVITKLYNSYNDKISVLTVHPDLFKNNPHIDFIYDSNVVPADSILDFYTIFNSFNLSYDSNGISLKHNVMDIRQLHAASLGFQLSVDEMEMTYIPEDYINIKDLPEKYILFHPVQTWPSRTWESSKWINLANMLNEVGIHVVLTGKNSSENGFFNIEKPVFDFNPKLGLNLLNKANISQTWWLIKKSMGFVTMDSGLLHLAGTTDSMIYQLGSSIKNEFRAPYRMGSQSYKYKYISGPCKSFCASDMKHGVKEWNSIMGVPPLIGCLENKPTFECHPNEFIVFNEIMKNIKNERKN